MAKFRIWAQSISDVYIDIEAETKEKAMEVAEEADGGDYHDSGYGDWVISDNAEELDEDANVDYTYDEFFEE